MADQIVVVAGNRVTEVGTHDDLVRRGGLYAELYRLQASVYQAPPGQLPFAKLETLSGSGMKPSQEWDPS